MTTPPSRHRDLLRVFATALLALFLLPGAGWLFAQHGLKRIDADQLASIETQIDTRSQASPQQKEAMKREFRETPPSAACRSDDPRLERYREGVCPAYSPLWQFSVAARATGWTLVLGAFTLLASLALGALAFASRGAQRLSFKAGWNLLVAVAAVETVVQGALVVWLSFWVTAFFFHLYAIKLILLAGVMAGLAVVIAVFNIFKRPALGGELDGELLREADCPALWQRVRELAARLKTAPPDQIVAGIDTNFFVTESPMTVQGQRLTGRTLFVSLPLLRVLDRSEADAVLAHELAHFRGGDTASSAALGPLLVQYDHYCAQMHAGRVTLPVYWMMRMFRVIFEFALQRDSREREFKADRIAAKLLSPRDIVHSLLKVAAYARYRGQVEQNLFEHDRQHAEALGIASRVAAGLRPYANSPMFTEAMEGAGVPHPFDSHPTLPERMRNVGYRVEPQHYASVVLQGAAESWVQDIPPAAQIEARLWGAYEQQFAAAHEQSLAWRYEPANEEERAVVLKYFPNVVTELKGGARVEIRYDGLLTPEGQLIGWDAVKSIAYEDATVGADVLKIVHPEKGWLGAKNTKLKLPGLGKQRDAFKQVLGLYWQRHQVMRQQQ